MGTEKVHYMTHCAITVMKWGDLINMGGDAAETAHKYNVKARGKNTNQGSKSARRMLLLSTRQQAASLLCQAVQGVIMINISNFREYYTN